MSLYYTIEQILGELAHIITHNSNLPTEIIECYTELQELSVDLNLLIQKSGMDQESLSEEIYEVYQDMLDLYINYLEDNYTSNGFVSGASI